MRRQRECKCGYVFDEACGKYGCPNCLGEGEMMRMNHCEVCNTQFQSSTPLIVCPSCNSIERKSFNNEFEKFMEGIDEGWAEDEETQDDLFTRGK